MEFTVTILKWLAVLCLCAPGMSFQLSQSLIEPLTYEGITYVQRADGKWYATEAHSSAENRAFLDRLLVKFNDDENPWGLDLCTTTTVNLHESLSAAEGRYIGFGWSLLVFPSEAAGSAAAQYFESLAGQDQPIIQFDAAVSSHQGAVEPNDQRFGNQNNLENTPGNCGTFRDPGHDDGDGDGRADDQINFDDAFYHPLTLDILQVWDMLPRENHDTIIAVIDTSFYLDHEDMVGAYWKNIHDIPDNGLDDDGNGFVDDYEGFNFLRCNGNVNSTFGGHGNGVAGIIGAETDNGVGLSGIVSSSEGYRYAKIMPLVTGPRDDQTQNTVLSAYYQAMWYAYRNGADIVNASWGFQVDFPMPRDIQGIIDTTSNILIVAAVGNFFDQDDIDFPARYDNTLAVTTASCESVLDDFTTQSGSKTDITAPTKSWSVETHSSDPDLCNSQFNCYELFGGTSGAAPQISGLAALMLAENPHLSSRNLAFLVRKHGVKEGGIKVGGIVHDSLDLATPSDYRYDAITGHNEHLGFGLVNAPASVNEASFTPTIGNVTWDASGTGSEINPGEEIRISWERFRLSSGETVKIDLVDFSGNIINLVSHEPISNSGNLYQIPFGIPVDREYRIRIQLSRISREMGLSPNSFTLVENWVDLTYTDDTCDNVEKDLTWETSYPAERFILLEVSADGHLGAVFLENTGSATIYHHQLNSLLASQTTEPDRFVEQMNFETRLVGVPDNHVTSEFEILHYGILNVQACDQNLPSE
jgi:subtilisin family serine protease